MYLLYSLIYLINCASFLLVLINVRFATLECIMRCVCPLRNQDTLAYMLCTHHTHTAYTTAYQSYNHPNGYNVFAFLFLDKQEGPSTATIAMKCNWTHVCVPKKNFFKHFKFLYIFLLLCPFRKMTEVPALLLSLKYLIHQLGNWTCQSPTWCVG